MKLTICGSSSFAKEMLAYKKDLENLGHEIIVHPDYEGIVKGEKSDLVNLIEKEHSEAKKINGYIQRYHDRILLSNGILVLNFDKNGIKNYIGGNTFLEIGFAHTAGKRVFLLNDIPEVSYKDEILAMCDVVLNGDINKIPLR